jgi:ketosteroid isomerase-like protein
MSQENVEIVRKSLEALNPDLDTVTEFWHPEIDWRAIEGAPDDIGVFTGQAAMRHYYEQWFETFAELRAEIEDMVDAGEQVVVSLHVIGKMEGSHAEIDMHLGIVYTVRKGLIVRGREYATREEALKAAGLRE